MKPPPVYRPSPLPTRALQTKPSPAPIAPRLSGNVVQPLIVRVSQKHGKKVTMGMVTYQAEVQDAVEYLEGRNHGPAVDYFKNQGPYNWSGTNGNYVVAHGDHGGIGISAADFADGLIARGLTSGVTIKFIVCSAAKALGNSQSYAHQVKQALLSKSVNVTIIASDQYVKYSTQGKMIYANQDGIYNEERDDLIAERKWKAGQAFLKDLLALFTECYDLAAVHIYEDQPFKPIQENVKQRVPATANFSPLKNVRTIQQANDNLLAAIKKILLGDNPGKLPELLAAFFKTPRGTPNRERFRLRRAQLHTDGLAIWRQQAKLELDDYKKHMPHAFVVDPVHPNRAPRDPGDWQWKIF